MESFDKLKEQKQKLINKEIIKIVGLTKEMINCLKIPHTKFKNGWYGSCLDCEIHKQDKVIRDENNVCTIAADCMKWLEEQEKCYSNKSSSLSTLKKKEGK